MIVWRWMILGLMTSTLILGCATFSRKKPPEKASPSVRAEFDQIQIELAAGAGKKAQNRLKKLVANHPHTDISDDALMILGRLHFKARDYQAAYDSFISVANSDVFSPSEAEALLSAGKCLQRLGRPDEALALTQKSIKIPGISEEMKLENYKLRFAILGDLGDRLDALRAVVYIADKDPDQNSRDSYRVRALDFVESRLTDQELETVAKSSEFGFVRGTALFRVGVQSFEQRDFSRARDTFTDAIEILQTGELVERAKGYIAQIDSRREVDARTVGAVLPLTGRHAAIAQKTLRGLQLGLGIYGANRSDLRLAVVDSEGNPDGARRAVERLVGEDHVIAVVGSLLSREATAVASKADELGVPSLALSQKAGLTDIGDTVFRNSLTSEMQVRQLVKVAMDKMGLKRFAILYPNDAYGV
ncbi:MAG: ABC transporter substrate-binding protein, partial [Bdellovibrionales bacterium]